MPNVQSDIAKFIFRYRIIYFLVNILHLRKQISYIEIKKIYRLRVVKNVLS